MRRLASRAVLALSLLTAAVLAPVARAQDLPLVWEDTFSAGADRWTPADPASWKLIDVEGGRAYSLFTDSKYAPPHRSPVNIALAAGPAVAAFTLDVRLRSTIADYNHRDAVLIFGYQDPAHFYYVHFGKKTDDHANQIFIVNNAARTKISTKTTPGTDWDDAWHQVRVTRDPATGSIAVFFDDMTTPVMTATDRTFPHGRIGIGSFDDTADFDTVTLHGAAVQPK
jgi:hypothetical protein